MLKHNPKLKRLWRDCEVLSMIAGKTLTTKAFQKEMLRIVQRDLEKVGRIEELEEAIAEVIFKSKRINT